MFEAAMWSDLLNSYMNKILPERPDVVVEMEAEAEERDFPIVGPHVGRFLAFLARVTGARRVLELGSGFGYSAYWFLSGMPEDGKIVMTDTSEANKKKAFQYFSRLGLESRINYKIGDAVELFRECNGQWDIIYNDIDKEQYPEVLRIAARKLRPGGIFITDNVLWSGKVAKSDPDDATRAIQEFNRLLYADERFFSTIVPLRDGLALAVRK